MPTTLNMHSGKKRTKKPQTNKKTINVEITVTAKEKMLTWKPAKYSNICKINMKIYAVNPENKENYSRALAIGNSFVLTEDCWCFGAVFVSGECH